MKGLTPYLKVLGVILILVLIGIGLYIVPPHELVQRIGVENSYLVGFLIALFAGVSSFTGSAAYATVAALAQGGADPIILGIVAGIGLFLSDTIFYALIYKGFESVSDTSPFYAKLQRTLSTVPVWLALSVVYLYTAFTPLPNDLLLIALLAVGYSYRVFAPVLLAGAITLMLLLTHVGLMWI